MYSLSQVSVFKQLLADIREVKHETLKHLHAFICLLPQEKQKEFLPLLIVILHDEQMTNCWRMRSCFVKELNKLTSLFDEEELSKFLSFWYSIF